MATVPLLAVATALAVVPPAVLAGLVWRSHEQPGAKPYALLLATVVAYDVAYAASMVVGEAERHRVVFGLSAVLMTVMAIAWLLFTLEYTGRLQFATRRVVLGLLVVPVLGTVALVWPTQTGLVYRDYTVTRQAGVFVSRLEFGPLGAALVVLGFSLLSVGLLILLRFVVSDPNRYGRQVTILGVVAIAPGVATVVRLVPIPGLPPVNVMPFAFAAGAPLIAFGVTRWDLFSFAPATLRIGQAAAIDDLREAVIIVDETTKFVDVNSAGARLFDRPVAELVQTPIEELLGASIDPATPETTVTLESSRGRREFTLTISPIDGPRNDTIGYTLVLHDITGEKQRRQRFEVLNRILRHNLRNSMNAVVGYSRELEHHVDDDGEWMVDRISSQSTQLIELGEKVGDIDRVTAPAHDHSTFAVTDCLERTGDRIADKHDGLSVTVHAPESLELTTNEAIFEQVVEYAAQTMASYAGDEAGRLFLSATPTAIDRPWITLTVTSNGAPVPAEERGVIERGEETPLEHSHDLDLWLVSWGVESLGGELGYIDDDDRPGLSLRIPDFETARDDPTWGRL